MINKLVKISLVATSLAPILLTLWFIEISNSWQESVSIYSNLKMHCFVGKWYLLAAALATILCWLLIALSQKKLERVPVKILSIKTVDNEIVGFLLVYMLPLIYQPTPNFSISIFIFVSLLFFIVIYNSNLYHFNPILSVLGYHFYEVSIDGGITYVLITKKTITNCKTIDTTVQLTDYMIMEI